MRTLKKFLGSGMGSLPQNRQGEDPSPAKMPSWFPDALMKAQWKDGLTFQRKYPTPLAYSPGAELTSAVKFVYARGFYRVGELGNLLVIQHSLRRVL